MTKTPVKETVASRTPRTWRGDGPWGCMKCKVFSQRHGFCPNCHTLKFNVRSNDPEAIKELELEPKKQQEEKC